MKKALFVSLISLAFILISATIYSSSTSSMRGYYDTTTGSMGSSNVAGQYYGKTSYKAPLKDRKELRRTVGQYGSSDAYPTEGSSDVYPTEGSSDVYSN